MDEKFIVLRAIRNTSDLSTAMTQQIERSIKENEVQKGKHAEMDGRKMERAEYEAQGAGTLNLVGKVRFLFSVRSERARSSRAWLGWTTLSQIFPREVLFRRNRLSNVNVLHLLWVLYDNWHMRG